MVDEPDKPKSPDKPKRDPAKHAKKDPAKPTRAKASRPDYAPTPAGLADLLNPAIQKGTAGLGSSTGLQPPRDNSFERRADFAAAHTARASTPDTFNEAAQSGYVAKTPVEGVERELAEALGFDPDAPLPSGRRLPDDG